MTTPLVQRRRHYTVGQVATLFAVAHPTVRNWIDTGKLRGFGLPGSSHRRVSHEDLVAFILRSPGQFGLDLDRIFGPGWDATDDSWAAEFERAGRDDDDADAYIPTTDAIEAETGRLKDIHAAEMRGEGRKRTARGRHHEAPERREGRDV